MSDRVPDKELIGVIKACDGIKEGPWDWLDIGQVVQLEPDDEDDPVVLDVENQALGEYIAYLSPEVIQSVFSELLRLRSEHGK